jgi:hypothetical protein
LKEEVISEATGQVPTMNEGIPRTQSPQDNPAVKIDNEVQKLTPEESQEFAALQNRIKTNLAAFYEVGAALVAIRDKRLYRVEFRTFEAYCRDRLGMQRNYANKLIVAATVIDNLGTIEPKPQNESQARQLAKLPPEKQVEVWKRVIDSSHGNLTASHVEITVNPYVRRANRKRLAELQPRARREMVFSKRTIQEQCSLREDWAGQGDIARRIEEDFGRLGEFIQKVGVLDDAIRRRIIEAANGIIQTAKQASATGCHSEASS